MTLSEKQSQKASIGFLIGIAIVSVILWQTAIGSMLLYPFSILATWFHEMGHGVAAMITGSRFEELVIYSNASGYAEISSPADQSFITKSIIAAAGPLGPAVAGSIFIISSRNDRAAKICLSMLGISLLLTSLIWVRSVAGWIVLPPLGLITLVIAFKSSAKIRTLTIQFLGVQACISIWRSFDYLFSNNAVIGGQVHMSDIAQIANVMPFPYWFYSVTISAMIIGMLIGSIKIAYR